MRIRTALSLLACLVVALTWVEPSWAANNPRLSRTARDQPAGRPKAALQVHRIEVDGHPIDVAPLPGSRHALVVHRGAAAHLVNPSRGTRHERERIIDEFLAARGWEGQWTGGLSPESHYHATTYETLVVMATQPGGARVRYAGQDTEPAELTVEAGDVVVQPPGLRHSNPMEGQFLRARGAYPRGSQPSDWQVDPATPAIRKRIERVPVPVDPVLGRRLTHPVLVQVQPGS
jgi:uncharacterized protein YjlB